MWLTMRRWILGALAACAVAGGAAAQQADGSLGVELNKLEAVDDFCRIYLVVRNESATAYDSFKLDLVFFSPDGVIGDRLFVELGPVRGEKMTVEVFDLPEIACDGIGEILLNDVAECTSGGSEVANCVDRVALSSREGTTFFK